MADYLLAAKRAVDPEEWVEEAILGGQAARNESMI